MTFPNGSKQTQITKEKDYQIVPISHPSSTSSSTLTVHKSDFVSEKGQKD